MMKQPDSNPHLQGLAREGIQVGMSAPGLGMSIREGGGNRRSKPSADRIAERKGDKWLKRHLTEAYLNGGDEKSLYDQLPGVIANAKKTVHRRRQAVAGLALVATVVGGAVGLSKIGGDEQEQSIASLRTKRDGSVIEQVAALVSPTAEEGTLVIRGGTNVRHTPAVANAETPEDEGNIAFAVEEGKVIEVKNPLVFHTGPDDETSSTFYGFTYPTEDGGNTILWVSGKTTEQIDPDTGLSYSSFIPESDPNRIGGLNVISTSTESGFTFSTGDGTPIAQGVVLSAESNSGMLQQGNNMGGLPGDGGNEHA